MNTNVELRAQGIDRQVGQHKVEMRCQRRRASQALTSSQLRLNAVMKCLSIVEYEYNVVSVVCDCTLSQRYFCYILRYFRFYFYFYFTFIFFNRNSNSIIDQIRI